MIKMVTVKSSVDGFKFPPAISENTLDLTSDEIKVLSRACKGFGLFFNKVAKVSEADDTDQFWYYRKPGSHTLWLRTPQKNNHLIYSPP